MHVQLVACRLSGVIPGRFARRCTAVAPQSARPPGLLAKFRPARRRGRRGR